MRDKRVSINIESAYIRGKKHREKRKFLWLFVSERNNTKVYVPDDNKINSPQHTRNNLWTSYNKRNKNVFISLRGRSG